MRMPVRTLIASASAAVAAAASPATATWSVLIVDTRTGEIGLGSATCLVQLDLRETTPVLIAGVGAVTAQSAGDIAGRTRNIIRSRFLEGVPVSAILDELTLVDASHQSRQYGMVDVTGDVVTFTGDQAGAWRGGMTGQIGDLVYAVQGNVLSGGNVVQDAVDAVINTPGDMADKLLAAMQAARDGGGDGRCSCNSVLPESCGSPPPVPFKSAHIGYMLIARLDDQDQSRGYYFAPTRPGYYATTDIDNDGVEDIVSTSFNTPTIAFALNKTIPGSALSHLEIDRVEDIDATGVRDLFAEDVTGDGVDDLVFASASPAGVTVFVGDGSGDFDIANPLFYATANAPVRLAVGQLDGDAAKEIVISESTGVVSVLDADPTQITQRVSIDPAGDPRPVGLDIADATGDDSADIAVTDSLADSVTIYRNTGSGFSPWATASTGDQPVSVRIVDLNDDGDADLLVGNDNGESLSLLIGDGSGGFAAEPEIALNGDAVSADLADVNGDGLDDIVSFASTTQSIQIFTNQGDGTYAFTHQNRAGGGQVSVFITDLNSDGLPDLVSGSSQRGITVLDNLGDGTFPPFRGFANGPYFMGLNVPDAQANNPDPVDTLEQLFVDWRTSLEGRIDAVETALTAPSRVVAGSAYTIRITSQDWRGDALTPAELEAEVSMQGSGGSVTDVRVVSPGIVEVDLVSSGTPATDRVIIRLDDGSGPVRLMPDLNVRVIDSLADFDGNGVRNFFDIAAFISAFRERDPAADLTGEGDFDAMDVSAFVSAFQSP